MKKFYTISKLLLSVACLTSLAPSAMGKKLEVTVQEAGTLPELLSADQKKETTELKVSGPLNGTDLRLLREMSGIDRLWQKTDGKLTSLDLSDATMVEGGEPYVAARGTETTANPIWISSRADAMPEVLFSDSRLESIILPANIKAVYSAFSDATCLKGHIVVPEGVEFLGEWAFSSTAIEGITLPSTLKEGENKIYANKSALGSHVFDNCRQLRAIEFPAGVTILKQSAMLNCRSLEEITIPTTLEYIDSQCFGFCTSVHDIYAENTVPATAAWEAFKDMDFDNCTLHVPSGCVDVYRSSNEWSQFKIIVDDLASVIAIEGQDPFGYDPATHSLKAPEGALIEVFGAYGAIVATGRGMLDVTPLPHGIYIARCDSKSIKFTR